jgi:hypothetical protein
MSFLISSGVPRLIHQTWRDHNVPRDNGDPDSWKIHNPDWTYKLWTDDDLLHLMETEFPQYVDIFNAYPYPVQRADLGRYCILKRHGGIYADIDTICHQSLEPIAGEQRIILCEEPEEHIKPALDRGLSTMFFNGTMASPADHPFWDLVLSLCALMAPLSENDVLESTGPLLLSAAVHQWQDQSQLALNSCHLFANRTVNGVQSEAKITGPFGHLTLSTHLWLGSWHQVRREGFLRKIRGKFIKIWHGLFLGPRFDLSNVRRNVDANLLHSKIPTDLTPVITILIPVLNGESFLYDNLQQILALDYPKNQLRIIYGEGISNDRTSLIIAEFIVRYGSLFSSIEAVKLSRNGPVLARNSRWKAKYQYSRRSGLAKARNDLLKAGLTVDCDWILWLDVDVIGFAPDILQKLLAAHAKIVTPNCVLKSGGMSYDLNAFLEIGQPFTVHYYRHVKNGLFQPPANYWFRRHLDDLRYLERVPLHGVGGTMLLVQADVHRAGLDFPEIPYKDVLETEAFGYLARDVGVTPIGLPRVEVFHANA